MHTILHITPHLGGGVGSVLLNYLEKVKGSADFSHQVISLEYANKKAKLASKTTGFFLADEMSANPEGLLAAISQADIILIHWWNHPLLYALLVRELLPPARIIFWSHISGFHPPYVFNEPALHYPDLFVFTSPLSLDVPEVKNLPEERQRVLRVIWSTGGIEQMVSTKPKPHAGFYIGYIGTVDYGKLHPHFLRMSSRIKIPDMHFIVCGGPSEKKIQEESKQYGGKERFVFTGQISNIKDYLSEFDIFGYPLAPYHYGTCEQSLGESMAAGVPPVVLANPTESYIVENGITGVVAPDEDSYIRAIEGLYHNPDLRQRLADNARKAAMEKYSLELMIKHWEQVFIEALCLPKTPRQWSGKRQGKHVSAAYVFIESLGAHGKDFKNSLIAQNKQEKKAAIDGIKKLYSSSQLWRAHTRGTANHYSSFFPKDKNLKLWSDRLDIG
jgi:glycosyltransferase involved in cell wall biosynthesis